MPARLALVTLLLPSSMTLMTNCDADEQQGGGLQFVSFHNDTGSSDAVIVDGLPLVHTAQILPVDDSGKLVGGDDSATQIKHVFEKLAASLGATQSGLDRLVKLNFVVARDGVVAQVERFMAKQFASGRGPAVSYVRSPLPHAGALVGLDAVAVTDRTEGRLSTASRVLPPGASVYIAGQAEPGKTLAEATEKTLASLRATLKFLALTEKDVIQVKSFLKPMSAVNEVTEEMARFFGRDTVPPQVFVEWQSSLPIEIELIAQAGKDRRGPVVEFLTPPGMKASPVFSRVTRINRGKSIYISGLHTTRSTGPHDEITEIFDRLGEILKKTGSDFRYLAKATYYVTSPETTRKMGELRPKYYDPKRPPSASLAQVAGIGRAGKCVTLDVIAAPAE